VNLFNCRARVVIRTLDTLLHGRNKGLALAAYESLRKMTEDDSPAKPVNILVVQYVRAEGLVTAGASESARVDDVVVSVMCPRTLQS
jgi:hypothetical protein